MLPKRQPTVFNLTQVHTQLHTYKSALPRAYPPEVVVESPEVTPVPNILAHGRRAHLDEPLLEEGVAHRALRGVSE